MENKVGPLYHSSLVGIIVVYIYIPGPYHYLVGGILVGRSYIYII